MKKKAKTEKTKKTLLIWNDERVVARFIEGTEDQIDRRCWELRCELHDMEADDPRWQILDGHATINVRGGRWATVQP